MNKLTSWFRANAVTFLPRTVFLGVLVVVLAFLVPVVSMLPVATSDVISESQAAWTDREFIIAFESTAQAGDVVHLRLDSAFWPTGGLFANATFYVLPTTSAMGEVPATWLHKEVVDLEGLQTGTCCNAEAAWKVSGEGAIFMWVLPFSDGFVGNGTFTDREVILLDSMADASHFFFSDGDGPSIAELAGAVQARSTAVQWVLGGVIAGSLLVAGIGTMFSMRKLEVLGESATADGPGARAIAVYQLRMEVFKWKELSILLWGALLILVAGFIAMLSVLFSAIFGTISMLVLYGLLGLLVPMGYLAFVSLRLLKPAHRMRSQGPPDLEE